MNKIKHDPSVILPDAGDVSDERILTRRLDKWCCTIRVICAYYSWDPSERAHGETDSSMKGSSRVMAVASPEEN